MFIISRLYKLKFSGLKAVFHVLSLFDSTSTLGYANVGIKSVTSACTRLWLNGILFEAGNNKRKLILRAILKCYSARLNNSLGSTNDPDGMKKFTTSSTWSVECNAIANMQIPHLACRSMKDKIYLHFQFTWVVELFHWLYCETKFDDAITLA